MIPPLTSDGYLPPFAGASSTSSVGMAPFKTTIVDLASAFAKTPARKEAFNGLLELRQMLRDEGIASGFQWIDGSYVEDCEAIRGRPPADIDVVTFFYRPEKLKNWEDWLTYWQSTFSVRFERNALKKATKCDHYYEDLGLPGHALAGRVKYWFGLFSHQRTTGTWKGLLEIPLTLDDSAAWDWVNSEALK